MKVPSRFSWPLRIAAAVFLVGGAVGLGASAAQARGHASASTGPVFMSGYKCTVVATSRHRHVVGHAGDIVCGASGNDVLKAVGAGRIVLIGGPGHDKLIASRTFGSQDTLVGGTGPDTMVTGTGGDDVVDTGSGDDTINCPGGSSSGGTQGDESALRMAPSTLTVVGEDAGDSENSDCQGDQQDSATIEFEGTVNTVTGSPPTSINMAVLDANDLGQQFLTANNITGTPPSVDISLTGASIEVEGGGTLATGDDVEVAANASGSTLTAVDVQAELAGMGGFDE